MKNRSLNIALFSLMIACASCNKISENFQQDIIVNDTAIFEIPILIDSNSSAMITGIALSINLKNLVESNVNRYTIDQIKSTKITSLDLQLFPVEKDSIDAKNNFGNLETLRFRIAAGGSFGNIANTIISSTSTIGALAMTPGIVPDSLKTFLINPTRTYNVIVKAKAPTTSPFRVKAAASYTITLAK